MSLDAQREERPAAEGCTHAAWRSLDRDLWPVSASRNSQAERDIGAALVLDTPSARWTLRKCRRCELFAATYDARVPA